MDITSAEQLYNELRKTGIECIRQIIANKDDENQFCEFKHFGYAYQGKTPKNQLEEDKLNIVETVGGFLNTYGGVLLLGISKKDRKGSEVESHPIKDLEQTSVTIKDFIRDSIKPTPQYEVNKIEAKPSSDEGYIYIYVKEGLFKPYMSMFKHHSYWHRANDSTVGMPEHMVRAYVQANAIPLVELNLGIIHIYNMPESKVFRVKPIFKNAGSVVVTDFCLMYDIEHLQWVRDDPQIKSHVDTVRRVMMEYTGSETEVESHHVFPESNHTVYPGQTATMQYLTLRQTPNEEKHIPFRLFVNGVMFEGTLYPRYHANTAEVHFYNLS